MFSIKKVLYFTLLSLYFISCTDSQRKLEKAVGREGNIVITAPDKVLNNCKAEFNSLIPGTFATINTVNPKEFTQFFFNQRTVMVPVIKGETAGLEELLSVVEDDEMEKYFSKSTITPVLKKNVLALNQSVLYVFAPDMATFKLQWQAQSRELATMLREGEIDAIKAELYSDTATDNKNYFAELKDHYGLGVDIPGGFKLMKADPNFYWFQKPLETGYFGITINAYAYKDSSDFSYVNVKSMRDSFCKYNIKGELAGTYMGTTESATYPAPVFEQTTVAGHKAIKLRGYWTIRGLAMSGPYLRYVVLVPEQNSMFAFEGFVYKGDLTTTDVELRIAEAIATTIR